MHNATAPLSPVAAAAPATDAFGDDYAQWKNWDPARFGAVARHQRHYFAAEIRRCAPDVAAGARVLEIGFGHGAFLAWGAARGWHMHGTEAIDALVQAARDKGYDAKAANALGTYPEGHFDLVVAFDVLEHIPQAQLPDLLRAVRRVLRPGGTFVARFPNADSPFGLALQHGDMTHVSALGRGKLIYLARRLGADVAVLGGEAQPWWMGWSLTSAQRVLAAPLRALSRAFVRMVWLPHSRIDFWSLNLVVALRWPTRPRS